MVVRTEFGVCPHRDWVKRGAEGGGRRLLEGEGSEGGMQGGGGLCIMKES